MRGYKPRIKVQIVTRDASSTCEIKAPHVTEKMTAEAHRLVLVLAGVDLPDPFAAGWRACAEAFAIDGDLSEERLELEVAERKKPPAPDEPAPEKVVFRGNP